MADPHKYLRIESVKGPQVSSL